MGTIPTSVSGGPGQPTIQLSNGGGTLKSDGFNPYNFEGSSGLPFDNQVQVSIGRASPPNFTVNNIRDNGDGTYSADVSLTYTDQYSFDFDDAYNNSSNVPFYMLQSLGFAAPHMNIVDITYTVTQPIPHVSFTQQPSTLFQPNSLNMVSQPSESDAAQNDLSSNTGILISPPGQTLSVNALGAS